MILGRGYKDAWDRYSLFFKLKAGGCFPKKLNPVFCYERETRVYFIVYCSRGNIPLTWVLVWLFRNNMKQLYINLDSRPDRRAEAEAEFARVGLNPERFAGVTNDNPCLGFNKSVYECMRMAEGDSLLLFEDDVVFDTPLPIIPVEPSYMTVHLGCNLIGTDKTDWLMPTRNERLILPHLHNCWQSHATLYSAECVEYIINNFPYHKDQYQKEGLIIFDEWLRVNVLPMERSYVMNPMICYQRPSFSNIWNIDTNYTGAHNAGNEWMKKNL